MTMANFLDIALALLIFYAGYVSYPLIQCLKKHNDGNTTTH